MVAKQTSAFHVNKKELEYETRAAKMTADRHTIQVKPIRPRYGFILNKGWSSRPDDVPCETCGNPAATVAPTGERRHPNCKK